MLWGTHGYSLLWLLPLETPVCSLLVLWGTHGCSPLSFVSPESSGRSLLVLRGAPKGAHPHSWALWGTPSVRRGGSLWPLPPSSPRLGAGGGEPRRSFPPPSLRLICGHPWVPSAPRSQQDAQEFLKFFMDRLHAEINRKGRRTPSILSDTRRAPPPEDSDTGR